LDGFTLEGNGASDRIIEITAGGGPTIRNNAILANPGAGADTYAIIGAGSWALVENNTIDGGSSPNPTGVYLMNDMGTQLINNEIDAGPGNLPRALWIQNPPSAPPFINRNDIQTTGNAATTSTYAVFLQAADTTEIVDNDITAGFATGASAGIRNVDSDALINDNRIRGGGELATPVGTSMGVHAQNAAGTIINNDIRAGVGVSTRALWRQNAGYTYVENNILDAGTATTGISRGVLVDGATDTWLVGNSIRGGSGPSTSGIEVTGTASASIISNTVFGGTATGDSRGVALVNANGTHVVNNTIHGGAQNGVSNNGLEIIGCSAADVAIYSNTIYGGRTTAASASGAIYTQASNPQVVNNILIAGAGLNPPAAYWQQDANTPARFLNNLLLGVDAAAVAYWMGGTPWITETDIEINVFGGPAPGFAFGTLARMGENPAAYFNRFRSSGGESEFLGDNWRLSGGGSAPASTGGYDVAANPDGIPVLFFYDYDKDGNFRNAPWSIGAYE
jgi:hypothetical protein